MVVACVFSLIPIRSRTVSYSATAPSSAPKPLSITAISSGSLSSLPDSPLVLVMMMLLLALISVGILLGSGVIIIIALALALGGRGGARRGLCWPSCGQSLLLLASYLLSGS